MGNWRALRAAAFAFPVQLDDVRHDQQWAGRESELQLFELDGIRFGDEFFWKQWRRADADDGRKRHRRAFWFSAGTDDAAVGILQRRASGICELQPRVGCERGRERDLARSEERRVGKECGAGWW